MSIPTRLYKYEPFSVRALQNLKDQIIYFGSPRNFNDPYDCALTPRFKNPSASELEKIRQYNLSKPALNEKLRKKFKDASIEELRRIFLKTGNRVLNEKINDFLKNQGVSCFSERVDSLLMWSHYADSCKGFCLEFDTSAELFGKFRKVQYAQEMPEFDIVPMLCDDDFDPITKLYCTKAIDWAYEHEWRGIHYEAGTPFGYESTTLTGIFLGPDMPETATEIVALIIAGQNEHAQLWKGTRSTTTFSVEFTAIKYTSYLEAKRKGRINETESNKVTN